MKYVRGIYLIFVDHPGFPTASGEHQATRGFSKWSTAVVPAKNHMLDSFVVSKSN